MSIKITSMKRDGMMSEHEHDIIVYSDWGGMQIWCDTCDDFSLDEDELQEILNTQIVKTIINVVIARRDEEDN